MSHVRGAASGVWCSPRVGRRHGVEVAQLGSQGGDVALDVGESVITRRWTAVQAPNGIVTTIRFRDPAVRVPYQLACAFPIQARDVTVTGRVTDADLGNLFPRMFSLATASQTYTVHLWWWNSPAPSGTATPSPCTAAAATCPDSPSSGSPASPATRSTSATRPDTPCPGTRPGHETARTAKESKVTDARPGSLSSAGTPARPPSSPRCSASRSPRPRPS